jgi:hypothetical protein
MSMYLMALWYTYNILFPYIRFLLMHFPLW